MNRGRFGCAARIGLMLILPSIDVSLARALAQKKNADYDPIRDDPAFRKLVDAD